MGHAEGCLDPWLLLLPLAGREPLLTEIGPYIGSSLPSSLSFVLFVFFFSILELRIIGTWIGAWYTIANRMLTVIYYWWNCNYS